MKRFITVGVKSNGEHVIVFDSSVAIKKQLSFVQSLKGTKSEYISCAVYADSVKRFEGKVQPQVKEEEVKEKKK
jgi:hypothetical protein